MPGWIARRKARRGVDHRKGGVTLGYRGAFSTAGLDPEEFAKGGLAFGAPGSGKTTLLQLIIQAAAPNGACVVLDFKASRDLRRTVQALDGTVFSIGGRAVLDPLDPNPDTLADQLLAGEPADANAPRVFRDGARLAITQLGRALREKQRAPELGEVTRLLRSGEWEKEAREALGPRFMPLVPVEKDGVKTFAAGLAALMLGPAAANIGNGPGALRLREVVQGERLVLFSLDAGLYRDTAVRLAGMVLVSLQGLLAERLDAPGAPPCVVVIDEAHRIGWVGHRVVDLLATGRESRVPVILASPGPSDLEELGKHLLARALQDARWWVLFAQRYPDSEVASKMLGMAPKQIKTHGPQGVSWREEERPVVLPRQLEDLATGDAYVRVPPKMVACVRIALPVSLPLRPRQEPVAAGEPLGTPSAEGVGEPVERDDEALWAKWEAQIGPEDGYGCRLWTGETKRASSGVYGRMRWTDVQGRRHDEGSHRMVWTRRMGPLGDGETIDHTCPGRVAAGLKPETLCQVLEHMAVVTKDENTRRMQARRRAAREKVTA